jgi:simple sugar transport system permease protein
MSDRMPAIKVVMMPKDTNAHGTIFGGVILALSYLGGEAAQIDLGMPNAVTGIFQGVLLFFLLACDVLILYRLRGPKPAVAGGA